MGARPPFASLGGALAIVSGSAGGIGAALCEALIAEGCSVAHCDLHEGRLQDVHRRLLELAADGVASAGDTPTSVSAHVANVADEASVARLVREVGEAHATKGRKLLLFNNAGVAGGSSILGDRQAFDRVFDTNWLGVYLPTRAFLPILLESSHGCIVNTSSILGVWANTSFFGSNTAYSASKFAVKGFTEALIADFRLHAPHLSAAVVMPGHIGTGIVDRLPPANLAAFRDVYAKAKRHLDSMRGTGDYEWLERAGVVAEYSKDLANKPDSVLASEIQRRRESFGRGGMKPKDAAQVILNGIKQGQWRILVGDDAHVIDRAVRRDPEGAYSARFADPTYLLAQARSDGGRGAEETLRPDNSGSREEAGDAARRAAPASKL